jgi:class 3 adenylate cyclase
MTKVKRKLATILATDCVGFSKHMETDEESTLASLNACRTIIDSHINDHGGRIFHTAGDSVIAEFDSPVECVNAALKFQDALYARNQEDEVHPALQWRVGVHVDDIIIEGDNVYGSGVNIAARLESHCEPGEILVSRVVREQVAKRVSFSIDSAGSRSLKNIAEDFEVFSVATSFSQAANKAAPTVQPTVVSSVSGSDQRKPKLAILPFNNASGDDESTASWRT